MAQPTKLCCDCVHFLCGKEQCDATRDLITGRTIILSAETVRYSSKHCGRSGRFYEQIEQKKPSAEPAAVTKLRDINKQQKARA